MKKTWATRYKERAPGPGREILAMATIYETFTENNFTYKTKARMLAWVIARLESDERKAGNESKDGRVE